MKIKLLTSIVLLSADSASCILLKRGSYLTLFIEEFGDEFDDILELFRLFILCNKVALFSLKADPKKRSVSILSI